MRLLDERTRLVSRVAGGVPLLRAPRAAIRSHRAVDPHSAGRPRRLLTVQWGLDAAGLGRPPRLPPMDPQYEQWVRQALVEPEQSKVQLIYALDQSYHHLHEARGAGTGQVERDCARV